MKTYTKAELAKILKSHAKWLHGELGGEWANLREADLSGADLSEAKLTEASLYRADLTGAILTGAILTGADLSEADLSEADLSWAVWSRGKTPPEGWIVVDDESGVPRLQEK